MNIRFQADFIELIGLIIKSKENSYPINIDTELEINNIGKVIDKDKQSQSKDRPLGIQKFGRSIQLFCDFLKKDEIKLVILSETP